VWNLLASEAPAKRDNDAGQRPQEPERRQPVAAAMGWQRPMDDSEIPPGAPLICYVNRRPGVAP
jgi:hypothetical protein